ncbi:uncharacterized protein B0I36DRAFT_358058 [Microdochium trichocladiopsis]|uniref:Uncharacterized protein n=1 Tax=Microdochium trichocladiopsis TaxID=1682393 RepID=A0A9P8YIU0_9PEZI|nr:uncharacterized protein B0I36DRAFT_358058 [Microdochium trichocladiopsis]KAH7040808.1 hypothetical protein B0I36DRAFT_358058 [Microdochium trichocladiopsis]
MSVSSPTPPLLLTKRLTAFLHTNLNAQVHTALLTTLAGKLLAHASTLPVSTLRTQCTVAASLWATYATPETSSSIADALPASQQADHSQGSRDPTPSALTLQMAGALVVLRQLKCGLLFVCIGPTPEAAAASVSGEYAGQRQQRHGQHLQTPLHSEHPTPTIGSPAEVASVHSAAPSTTTLGSVGATGVVLMRRHAEELAKWLDDKLGTLGVPAEGATFES